MISKDVISEEFYHNLHYPVNIKFMALKMKNVKPSKRWMLWKSNCDTITNFSLNKLLLYLHWILLFWTILAFFTPLGLMSHDISCYSSNSINIHTLRAIFTMSTIMLFNALFPNSKTLLFLISFLWITAKLLRSF